GKVVRPKRPDAEKLTVYECGEPTIGSAWVQFDLRFYVVALLFVIFDVEMAFFFPWAVVFGKTNQLAGDQITLDQRQETAKLLAPTLAVRLADLDRQIAGRDAKKAEIQKHVDSMTDEIGRLALDDPKRPRLTEQRDALKVDMLGLDMLPRRRADLITKTKEP